MGRQCLLGTARELGCSLLSVLPFRVGMELSSPVPVPGGRFSGFFRLVSCVGGRRHTGFLPRSFQHQNSVCGWKGGGITRRLLKVNREEERVRGENAGDQWAAWYRSTHESRSMAC